jgi:hypothetical protein
LTLLTTLTLVLVISARGHLGPFARFMTAAEVLACATSGNAELLALSGQRSPYPGPLGVVAAGRRLIYWSSMLIRSPTSRSLATPRG